MTAVQSALPDRWTRAERVRLSGIVADQIVARVARYAQSGAAPAAGAPVGGGAAQ